MSHFIDARGQACPAPVILARRAIGAGVAAFTVAVDNTVAVENLRRLADHNAFTLTVTEAGGTYRAAFSRSGEPASGAESAPIPCAPRGNWCLFVSRDTLGEGDRELGQALLHMFFYTQSQSDTPPAAVLFVNAGVRLPTTDPQVIEHLKTLAAQGTEVLVCGTCLNFYGLTERLAVGTVSNMYDLAARMADADKVVTL